MKQNNVYQTIKDLTEKEDYAKALALCKRWLIHPKTKDHPDTPKIQYAQAVIHYKTEQYQQVIETLASAAAPRAILLTAFAYRALEQHQQALEQFQHYLEIAPKKPEVLVMIAICYEALGQYETAIPYLQEVEQLKHSYAYLDDVLYHLGVCYENTQNSQQAIEAYTSVVELFHDSPFYLECAFRLGYLYHNKGLFEKAVQYLERITDPNNTFYQPAQQLLNVCQRNKTRNAQRLKSYALN